MFVIASLVVFVFIDGSSYGSLIRSCICPAIFELVCFRKCLYGSLGSSIFLVYFWFFFQLLFCLQFG